MSARTTLLAGGDPFGHGNGFGGASGDAFAPGGEHGRVGGRGRQGDDDVDGEGGQQAVEDRLVGEDAERRHQDDDGEPADGDGGEGALGGAAPPQQSAEDRHQQPADEQVVGDGQGLHDVVQRDRGEDHGDAHEQDEQAVAADLVVVVALRCAGEAAQPGPDVVVGDGRAGDERAGGRGHHRGEGGGQHQPAHPEGEFVLDGGGEGVVGAGQVGVEHLGRGADDGAGEGVGEAVGARDGASPAGGAVAAGGEHALPDVLADEHAEG